MKRLIKISLALLGIVLLVGCSNEKHRFSYKELKDNEIIYCSNFDRNDLSIQYSNYNYTYQNELGQEYSSMCKVWYYIYENNIYVKLDRYSNGKLQVTQYYVYTNYIIELRKQENK